MNWKQTAELGLKRRVSLHKLKQLLWGSKTVQAVPLENICPFSASVQRGCCAPQWAVEEEDRRGEQWPLTLPVCLFLAHWLSSAFALKGPWLHRTESSPFLSRLSGPGRKATLLVAMCPTETWADGWRSSEGLSVRELNGHFAETSFSEDKQKNFKVSLFAVCRF